MKILEELKKHTNVDKEIEKFLLEECDRKIYQKGELLSKQSQYNNTVFFVEEGLLRMFYYENGKDITTNFYSEGKSFGSIDTIFMNVPSIYNIETLEESTITFCDYKKL